MDEALNKHLGWQKDEAGSVAGWQCPTGAVKGSVVLEGVGHSGECGGYEGGGVSWSLVEDNAELLILLTVGD